VDDKVDVDVDVDVDVAGGSTSTSTMNQNPSTLSTNPTASATTSNTSTITKPTITPTTTANTTTTTTTTTITQSNNKVNNTIKLKNLLSNIENAEQLSWYNSGLSLVILPESKTDEIELIKRGITHRSPIDVDTGCRVKDISPAAAMAANIMLDRVRKGKEVREIMCKERGVDLKKEEAFLNSLEKVLTKKVDVGSEELMEQTSMVLSSSSALMGHLGMTGAAAAAAAASTSALMSSIGGTSAVTTAIKSSPLSLLSGVSTGIGPGINAGVSTGIGPGNNSTVANASSGGKLGILYPHLAHSSGAAGINGAGAATRNKTANNATNFANASISSIMNSSASGMGGNLLDGNNMTSGAGRNHMSSTSFTGANAAGGNYNSIHQVLSGGVNVGDMMSSSGKKSVAFSPAAGASSPSTNQILNQQLYNSSSLLSSLQQQKQSHAMMPSASSSSSTNHNNSIISLDGGNISINNINISTSTSASPNTSLFNMSNIPHQHQHHPNMNLGERSIKSSRSRSNNSLVTLLSLSPNIENRRSNGKLSAAASAMLTHGISHIPSSKKGGGGGSGGGSLAAAIGGGTMFGSNSSLGIGNVGNVSAGGVVVGGAGAYSNMNHHHISTNYIGSGGNASASFIPPLSSTTSIHHTPQINHRHPFPTSQGAIFGTGSMIHHSHLSAQQQPPPPSSSISSEGLTLASAGVESSVVATATTTMASTVQKSNEKQYVILALPPSMTSIERKKKQKVANILYTPKHRLVDEKDVKGVKSVLENFRVEITADEKNECDNKTMEIKCDDSKEKNQNEEEEVKIVQEDMKEEESKEEQPPKQLCKSKQNDNDKSIECEDKYGNSQVNRTQAGSIGQPESDSVSLPVSKDSIIQQESNSLEEEVSSSDNELWKDSAAAESSSASSKMKRKTGWKRHITEIGLVEKLREKRPRFDTSIPSKTSFTPSDDSDIDPYVALSVLHAIGVVKESVNFDVRDNSTANSIDLVQLLQQKQRDRKSEFTFLQKNLKENINVSSGSLKRPLLKLSRKRTLSDLLFHCDDEPIRRGPPQTERLMLSRLEDKNQEKILENDSRPSSLKEVSNIELPQLSSELKLASYVPSLRGGGEENDHFDNLRKDGSNMNNGMNLNPNITESMNNHFTLASIQNNAATSSAHIAVPQQQLQAQQRHNAEMFKQAATALWNDQQNRNELAALRAQAAAVAPMLPHQIASSMDGYTLVSTAMPTSNGAINVLSQGNLQAAQTRQALQHTLGGGHEQFLTAATTLPNHQIHLVSNSMQQPHTNLQQGHLIHRPNSDINDYLSGGINQVQVAQSFNPHQNDWTRLGAAHNIITANHAHNAISRSSIDPTQLSLSSHQTAMLVRERAMLLAQAQEQQIQARFTATAQNAAIARDAKNSLAPNSNTILITSPSPDGQNIGISSNRRQLLGPSINMTPKIDIQNIMSYAPNSTMRPTTAPATSPRASQGTNTTFMALNQQRPSSVPPSSTGHSPIQKQAYNQHSPFAATNQRGIPSQSKKVSGTIEKANKKSAPKLKQQESPEDFLKLKIGTNTGERTANSKGSKVQKGEELSGFDSKETADSKVQEKAESDSRIQERILPGREIKSKDNSEPQTLNEKSSCPNIKSNEESDQKAEENVLSGSETKGIIISETISLEGATEHDLKDELNDPKVRVQKSFSDSQAEIKFCSVGEDKASSSSTINAETNRDASPNVKNNVAITGDTNKKKETIDEAVIKKTCEDLKHCIGDNLKESEKSKIEHPQDKIDNISAKPSSSVETSILGMHFVIPPKTEKIDETDVNMIVKGLFHLVLPLSESETKKRALLQYLLLVGSAIPLPKTLVNNPLKDRLNDPSWKSTITSFGTSTGSTTTAREIIGTVINIWLWANHKDVFKNAFAQSGRIDVDPQCKWLIHATLDVVTRELCNGSIDILKLASRPGQDLSTAQSNQVAIQCGIAVLVSQKLMRGLCVNEEMDHIIPNFDRLVQHLNNLRICALHALSQERALLATLVSRRSRMSEAFSHAYTSSMVRAGEALGYDDLGEIVQDESTKTSTLLPFDILSDSSGAWEDPCRPNRGFIPGLDSDELFKRAHSRSIIQKSLKKLQDRHSIKGGVSNAGPYADVQPSDQGKLTIKAANGVTSISPPKSSPRSSSGSKRKGSYSLSSGMGGGSSGDIFGSSILFNPNHYSSPFVWDTDDIENTPYGRESRNSKMRLSSKRPRLGSSTGLSSLSISPSPMLVEKEEILSQDPNTDEDNQSNKDDIKDSNDVLHPSNQFHRSTHEIEWSSVARMFRPVLITEKSSSSSSHNNHHHSVAVPAGSTIIAPFCRKLTPPDGSNSSDEDPFLSKISDDESEIGDDGSATSCEEEDLNDENILEAHQKVLNHIRGQFDAMMTVRQQVQERIRRARTS